MSQETETLWQIGKSGRADEKFGRTGGLQAEFTYVVGSDDDPINQPQIPFLLVVSDPQPKLKGRLKKALSTNKLNIQFTLTQNYSADELTLFYDFFGAETDTLFINGERVTELVGVGEGKLRQTQIPLPALNAGEHTLTLTTAGGNGVHLIDYLKLDGVVAPQQPATPEKTTTTTEMSTTNPESAATTGTVKKSYVPTSQTGLTDYSYWWEYAREHAKQPSKPFRRGRIWS